MRNRETTANVVNQRARELRGQMTLAEKRLWQHLRAKQMNGLRFRRQEPVGNYIADFYCAAVKLVIELDGDSHSERVEADALRDDVLRSEGYIVLRFHNAQVFNDLTGVLETIESHCAAFACGHG
jgi:very-short-patch-repair endonuclease